MSFLKENKIDVVFLDIEMENFTGLQFIKTLSHKPQIILTTAYDKYAIEAFNLSVTDYLLKPISFERFLQSVDNRITSYNVCYTKLLRFLFFHFNFRRSTNIKNSNTTS